MNEKQRMRLTGALFVIGALLINIPYAMLIASFDYPDILRDPAGTVLVQFQAGGAGLIWQWFAFAWIGLPLLAAVLLLPQVMEDSRLVRLATPFGFAGLLVQVIGLLRWVFVVPVLARIYNDPAASQAARDAALVAFQVVNQIGGVLLGEHIGQFLTIFWMSLVSLAMLRSPLFKPWLGWFGLAASVVYLFGQTEQLATVLPGVPVVPQAGFIGSLLWLGWMIVTGIFLLRRSNSAPAT